MKLNSILIQDVDDYGRVLGFSKSTYKPGQKPNCDDDSVITLMSERIKEHKTTFKNVRNHVVTASTSNGKFILTFNGKQL